MNDGKTHLPAEAISDAKDGIVADTMNIRHKGGKLNVHLDKVDEDLRGKVDTANLATINGQRLDEKKDIVIGGGEGGGIIPDTEVIQGSPNAVSGGAVYDALKDLGSTSASLPSARITPTLEFGAYTTCNTTDWADDIYKYSADNYILYKDHYLTHRGAEKEFFMTKRTASYIACGGKIKAESNCELVAYDYDNNGTCLGARFITDKTNFDAVGCYVKFNLLPGIAEDVLLEDGNFSKPSEENCKSSINIDIDSFDFLAFPPNTKLSIRTYRADGTLINQAFKLIKKQPYLTANIIRLFHAKVGEVKSVRIIVRDIDNIKRDDLYVKKIKISINTPTLKITTQGAEEIKNFGTLDGSIDVTSQVLHDVQLTNYEEKTYNKMLLRLPPNYQNKGKAAPLVFFKCSSVGFTTISAEDFPSKYLPFYKFIIDSGFAIFDCYGWGNTGTEGNSYGSTTNMECLYAAYNYVTEHYNVQKEIYIAGKSLAGLMCVSAIYSTLPVKAAGLLAPGLDGINRGWGDGTSERLNYARDMKFEGDFEKVLTKDQFYDDFRNDVDFKELITLNADKLCGYQQMLMGITNKMFNETFLDLQTYNPWMPNTFDKIIKQCPCPVKLWSAADDVNTLPALHTNFVRAVKNAGCIAEYREMPSGTGGHHAVDTGPNAEQVTNVTTRLGVHYGTLPSAYYELEKWFERFGG